MMWRSIKACGFYRGIFVVSILLATCGTKAKKNKFSWQSPGFYYSLLSFNTDSACIHNGTVARVTAVFKTQADSIFWDSHNNLNDHLFISTNAGQSANFFKYQVSRSCTSDSICLLIKTKDFFTQQFNIDSIPFFSKNDSVVKINFKIKALYTQDEFDQLRLYLQKEELSEIEGFFDSPSQFEAARDPLGFYWINRPVPQNTPFIETGDQVLLSYKAQFLNGRFFERSTGNFEFIYGTPDQILKGLNNVIGKLKLGQNAKILLPSPLAFGESGSSNGIVAPYTPLIYEVKIIDVKKIK